MQLTEKRIAPDFLSGGGEMGELIRNFNWANSPLGPPENWEPSLKTCVRIMLSSRQPIWIGWGKDLINLYNDPYIDIARGKHPWALGVPASKVWSDVWKDIEPALTNAMTKDIGFYVEAQLLIMERSGFPEEVYYTFSYTPVLGEDGKPAGIICYNTADTERIINERALKTLQSLDMLAHRKNVSEVYSQTIAALRNNDKDFPFAILHSIAEDGNTGILESASFEPAGALLTPRPTSLAGLERQFVGISSAVIKNRMTVSERLPGIGHFPKGPWNLEPKFIAHLPLHGVNKKFPLAILTVGLNPHRKFDEGYQNFLQLVADQISLGISNVIALEEERKRAKALEELDKAKTIFFSNISHEFRTPLTLMLGTIEEGIKDTETDQSSRIRMEVAHRNALRLLKLVNTLLDFSRIESGRQQASFVPTQIDSFTRELASNFRAVIEKAHLEFHVSAEKIRKAVYLDRQMWEKIVFNLLSNAFKYTLEGAISLRIFEAADKVVLEVEDTGVGIPEEALPHVFERFYRVEKVIGRSYEGSGIGLSLVKEFVHLHGGEITVQSIRGVGTTFRVILPSAKAGLAQRADVFMNEIADGIADPYVEEATSFLDETILPQSASNGKSDHKIKILVVDDNADMRGYLLSLLGKYFDVNIASNGAEALEYTRLEPPSLILSDIMMPVMDGIQMLNELKSDQLTAQIPVILLTARAGEESRIEGYSLGADDYLIKPFSANELLARVKVQLDLSRKRSEARLQIEKSEKQLTDLANSMPQVVWMANGEGEIFYFNDRASQFSGLEQVEDGKWKWENAIHKDDIEATLSAWNDAVKNKGLYEQEHRVKLSDGSYRWHLSRGFPQVSNGKNVVRWYGTATDIHDQKTFSEKLKFEVTTRTGELEKSLKELESFNYIASHDLQEPLRKIQTFISLLLRAKDDPILWVRYANKIQESAQRMSDLINSLLNYSRISDSAEAFVDTDLNKVLGDVLIDEELLISEHEASILSSGLPVIRAVPVQMHQLFSNLINNSIKFSVRKPEIRIESEFVNAVDVPFKCDDPNKVFAQIKFKDNGIGFEPQYKEQIFKLFQRLHSKSQYKGTGVGLSIVRKIIDTHDGRIQADSTLNEGATFTIWLPVS